jgi:hypothetical protein
MDALGLPVSRIHQEITLRRLAAIQKTARTK